MGEQRTTAYAVTGGEYGEYSHWCPTCDTLLCTICISIGRAHHRHGTNWLRPIKVGAPNLLSGSTHHRNCDSCGQFYFGNMFQGFECGICREYHSCLTCAARKVLPQHPVCKGQKTVWDFYLMPNK